MEVVSDSSVEKDTVDLPAGLFALGVPEYWLIDARPAEPVLTVQVRGETAFEPVRADADDYAASPVLARRYRLERRTAPSGLPDVRLLEAAAA